MLEAQHLTFAYDRKPILCDVSCTLPDGAMTAVIGPNGAGKSTLLRLLARQLAPGDGCVLADGQDVRRLTARAFARTAAYLPQSRPVPAVTVRTLVLCGRYAHMGALGRPSPADEAAADEALALAGMEALAGREVASLSGGQQQMAYLAMVMAQGAQHIVLDEPLAHLDVGVQLEVLQTLRRLADAGRCVCVAIHDLAMVPQHFDRALLLERGRVVCEESARQAFEGGDVERAFGVQVVRGGGISFARPNFR